MGITCETHVIFRCFFRKGVAGAKYIILKYSERIGKQEQIGQVLQALRF